MNNNMTLYDKYRQPPKEALKEFSNGRFSGTDINSQWRIKCLTEHFGECGKGWAIETVRLWSEKGNGNDVLCFADIKLHLKYGNEWGMPISATGGSKIIQEFTSKTQSNDEGYKMAVTDAIGVACKYLGIAADIYWDNDKTKYSQQEQPGQPQQPPLPRVSATAPKTTTSSFNPEESSLGCELCKMPISQKIADYSREKFGKALCMACQKKQVKK